jgi:hypothetical protein
MNAIQNETPAHPEPDLTPFVGARLIHRPMADSQNVG